MIRRLMWLLRQGEWELTGRDIFSKAFRSIFDKDRWFWRDRPLLIVLKIMAHPLKAPGCCGSHLGAPIFLPYLVLRLPAAMHGIIYSFISLIIVIVPVISLRLCLD